MTAQTAYTDLSKEQISITVPYQATSANWSRTITSERLNINTTSIP